MSRVRQFERCSTMHGGNRVQGIEMRCGRCRTTQRKPIGSQKSFIRPGSSEEFQRLSNIFIRDEWIVGDRPQDDRCPACVKIDRKFDRDEKHPRPQKEKPMAHSPAPVMRAEEPKPMSRDDGRIIFGKIEDVYDTNRQAYRSPWTDQKVATDLGIPRAWVENVRKQFFGPEGANPDITEALSQAQALLDEQKKLAERINSAKTVWGSLQAEAQGLNTRAEVLGRKIAELTRAVGR